jgi:hypothetical protein
LARIRRLVHDEELIREFRTNETAFTRTRKLPFPRMVALLVSGWKMSIPNRLNHLFQRLGQLKQRPSAAAFCRARRKIRPELFERLNREMVACLYEDSAEFVRRWKGRLIWAVDGTKLNLPDTAETRARYTVQTNQHDRDGFVQGMASVLYDVLNEVVIHPALDKSRSEKSFVLREHSRYFRPEAIVLYDRLYCDYAVIAFHCARGEDFVIRAPSSQTFKEVTAFFGSPKDDRIVELNVTAKQQPWVKELGLPRRVTVRLVKVVLPGGTVEVLITSLRDRETYPSEEFQGLYEKRWGIETYFDRLKNLLEVERFSAKAVIGIEQDFYGLVFLSTLTSVLLREDEEAAEHQSRIKGLKYTYRLNKSVSYLAVVDHVVELILDLRKSPEQAEEEIRLCLKGTLLPVRPGRKPERTSRKSARQLRFQRYGKRIWA